MDYRYRLSGYVFEINISLPELKEVDDEPHCALLVRTDISGKIPAEALVEESYTNSDLGLVCIQKKQFGFVAIWHNAKIEYTPPIHFEEPGIRSQILGTISMIMSAVMGYISLHAASVVINNKAVLFCGASGVGKSTITAHFFSQGYPVLSDDVTSLNLAEQGKVIAYPSIPRIKLSEASLALIGKTNAGLATITSKTLKYALPVAVAANSNGYELAAIIFPSFRDGEIMQTRISGINNKLQVAKHIYRKGAARHLYSLPRKRELFLSIAANIPMYDFYRPYNAAKMRDSLSFIETQLNEFCK